jgi:hypothetical protein
VLERQTNHQVLALLQQVHQINRPRQAQAGEHQKLALVLCYRNHQMLVLELVIQTNQASVPQLELQKVLLLVLAEELQMPVQVPHQILQILL